MLRPPKEEITKTLGCKDDNPEMKVSYQEKECVQLYKS